MKYKFCKGDSVQVVDTNRVGQIVSLDNKKATIDFDYITLTCQIDQIKPIFSSISTTKKLSPASVNFKINTLDLRKFSIFQPELDLHGLPMDEALQVLDKWIDQALIAGHRCLRIIHGKGKGLLRQQVHKYLKTHALLPKIINNHHLPGGEGVTLVEIR